MSISIPTQEREQRLVYKVVGERKLELIYWGPLNPCSKPAPIYFTITGGGWHSGTPESMLGFSKISIDWARQNGWAVASPVYRLSGEGVSMHQIVSDCMDACRYLAHYAKELNLDPQRVVTSGHSAGGHLALMMALAPHDSFRDESELTDDFKVIGTTPLSPPTVLFTQNVPQTLAFGVQELFPKMTEKDFYETSPVNYVGATSCPCLTVAGDKDDLVFPNSSDILIERYKQAGADGEVVYSHNGGHCFECKVENAVSKPDFGEVQNIIISFLNRFTGHGE